MSEQLTDDELDRRTFRRLQLLGTGVFMITFSVGSAVQAWVFLVVGEPLPLVEVARTPHRLFASLVATAWILGGVWLVRFHGRDVARSVLLLMVIGTSGGLVRAAILILLSVHEIDRLDLVALDSVAPAITTAVALTVGYGLARTSVALRSQQRAALRQALRAAQALTALESEELRVRRSVAEGLHGTLQQRLVIAEASLRPVQQRLAAAQPEASDADIVAGVIVELDAVRERDVRAYSQLLYPAGTDLGIAQAIRLLVQRLGPDIDVKLDLDRSVLDADDPERSPVDLATRVLAMRVLEEGISNALRHGHAGRLDLSARVDDGVLDLVVDDDGRGLPTADTRPSGGLAQLATRVESHGGTLTLTAAPIGGARLHATVPLRAPEELQRAG